MRLVRVVGRPAPPHRTSLDVVGADWEVSGRLEGAYLDGFWVFCLDDDEAVAVRVRADGQVASDLYPLTPRLRTTEVRWSPTQRVAPIGVGGGWAERRWFARDDTDDRPWDVIVVGQGMGGGVLHSALVERIMAGPGRVLGLEAGPLLFPTHVANLPRVYVNENPQGTPATWSTQQTFGTAPDDRVDQDRASFEVFALGGRSLYWGGLSPRVARAELEGWAVGLGDELWDVTYAQAERLLGVEPRPATAWEQHLLTFLRTVLPAHDLAPAPMAVRRAPDDPNTLPTGLFSTAELLLELRLGRGHPDGGFGPPYVHLAELVVRVERLGDDDWLVHTVLLPSGRRTTYRTRVVVLCGGAIETPRLALSSAAPGRSSLSLPERAGSGLTEHPMAYVKFQVAADSSYPSDGRSVHLLGTTDDLGVDAFNLELQVGSDALLDRHVVPWGRRVRASVDEGCIAGQLVFLGRAELGDGLVSLSGSPWLDLDLPGPTLESVRLPTGSRPVPSSWSAISDRVLRGLKARPLSGDMSGPRHLQLTASAPRVVAHEVGTMRIGNDPKSSVVDPDLQVHGLPGLYVCDNSVFASSPTANPSLTLAALALRLSDHVASSRTW